MLGTKYCIVGHAALVREARHYTRPSAREQFLRVIPDIQKNIESWLEEDESLRSIESRLQECHQQMALVKEIEAYGPNLNEHPLYTISQKYTTYKQAKNAVEDSMKALVKILKDFDAQIDSFAAAENAVRGPLLMTWVREFGTPAGEIEPIFRHIEEFLSNAGQSGMLAQCERAEAELGQTMQQAATLVRATLELLSQYAAIAQYYPRTHTEQYRVTAFREWLAAALEARSPDVCRDVAARLATLVAAEAPPPAPLAQQIAAYNYRLQALSVDATAKLNEAFERVQHDAASDTSVDDAYEEAKSNISAWLRAEEGAAAALECVVVGSLCALNRRYLMLEGGAQSAGDCLAELTSRDGEWFLDEMCALSTQAVEALSLLPLQAAAVEDPAVPLAVECVRDANRALTHLLQLNHNFSTVILPEALKKLHAEEPCTLRLVEEMEALVAATPMPLSELVAQLDLHLRYLLMDMELNTESAPDGGSWPYIDFHSFVRRWTSKEYVGLMGDEGYLT
ncbi:hypothetical protein EVAR_59629_1 [Eumeta japonica]|uniref:Uncharacterized protein n=1 Tax=Eumeta variegata TaxID=151549 RepID=A0A4C1YIB9_EUMVA|nr:hypothetical protein EVAR_59629_1 [Eumeta japonica]